MNSNESEIVAGLVCRRQPYESIVRFSSSPGIYAVFCALPRLPMINQAIRPDEILYIGKTESSQLSRDAQTHFADGRTGSSTLRRTLGALLREQLRLHPIPRNRTDAASGRLSSYKFDDESERRLTIWMRENLLLSFFEFAADRAQLEDLEARLIRLVIPKLNINKNRDNPYCVFLKSIRKVTARVAYAASTVDRPVR